MPLLHLLYRCPDCGHDPTEGEGDGVSCPACGTRFERSDEGALVRVTRTRRSAGKGAPERVGSELVHPRRLYRAIRDVGGPLPAARREDGTVRYGTAARMRRTRDEAPVRRRGRLLGFYERPGAPVEGTLTATDDELRFEPAVGRGSGPIWGLLEIAGIQVSSSALQVTPRGESMVEFGLRDDSPLRWDELLRTLLKDAYRRAERGEVVEFQPRIRTR